MDDPVKKTGGQFGEYAYPSSFDIKGEAGRERSAGDILKDIIANAQEIIRSEIRLAKTEMREEAGKAWGAARMLLAGALLGLYALGFVLLSAVRALSLAVSPWLAALLVGVALAIVTAVLISAGLARWRQFSPKPDKTIETVKENVEWVRNQTKS
jgi:uncharacterized membrane protein YqjE